MTGSKFEDYGRVLLRNMDGKPILWVLQASDGTYTINDIDGERPLSPEADLGAIVLDWKRARWLRIRKI